VTLEVRRFLATDVPAIDRLNERLKAGGVAHQVFGEPVPGREVAGAPRSHRVFVAAAPPEVRGGVGLLEQDFYLAGETVRAGWIKYPVAESLVDQAYSGVPGSLMLQLLREQPRLMALGMGGHGGALARLLAGLRWPGITVPFLFRLVRPFRVLRELRYARSTRLRRMLLNFLAFSGLGPLGYHGATAVRRLASPGPPEGVTATMEPGFGPWADEAWARCRDHYGFLAARTQSVLNDMYPADFEGLTRLRVFQAGREVGWSVVLRLDLRDGRDRDHFGRLAVGVVADGLAAPADAGAVIAAGVEHLLTSDVDILISNQSHSAWITALRHLGFYAGPSNFAFYYSPTMQALLESDVTQAKGLLLNRGDCDGPKWV